MNLAINTDLPAYVWCRTQITDPVTLVVECVLFLINLVVGGLLFNSIYNSDKSKRFIYNLVLFWWICIFVKTVLEIVLFGTYVAVYKQDFSIQQLRDQMLFSSFVSLFDDLTTFFILATMILIPCHWPRQFIKSIDDQFKSTQIDLGKHQEMRYRLFLYRCSKFYNFFEVYRKLRFVLIAVYVGSSLTVLFGEEKTITAFADTIYYIVLFESILIIGLYVVGLTVMSKVRFLIPTLTKPMYSQLVRQYVALAVCSSVRFGFIILVKLMDPVKYNPAPNCLDDSYDQSAYRSGVIGVALPLMHTIPALIVLYIYRNQQARDTPRGSLLVDEHSGTCTPHKGPPDDQWLKTNYS